MQIVLRNSPLQIEVELRWTRDQDRRPITVLKRAGARGWEVSQLFWEGLEYVDYGTTTIFSAALARAAQIATYLDTCSAPDCVSEMDLASLV
jgi:hypothetical protein